MMPLWLTYVGTTVLHRDYPDATVDIPWFYLGMSLVLFSVPCMVGVVIKSLCPERVSGILVLILRPLATVICFVHLFMAFEENAWIFALLDDWRIIVAAGVVPYSGFALSLAASYLIVRRPWRVAVTIMIETGVQNLLLVNFFLDKTMPRPDGQISIAVPVLILFITYVPLMVWALVLAVYDAATRKNRSKFDVADNDLTPTRSPDGLNEVISAGGDDDVVLTDGKKASIYFVDGAASTAEKKVDLVVVVANGTTAFA